MLIWLTQRDIHTLLMNIYAMSWSTELWYGQFIHSTDITVYLKQKPLFYEVIFLCNTCGQSHTTFFLVLHGHINFDSLHRAFFHCRDLLLSHMWETLSLHRICELWDFLGEFCRLSVQISFWFQHLCLYSFITKSITVIIIITQLSGSWHD